MFCSKKSAYIKRLWKKRITRTTATTSNLSNEESRRQLTTDCLEEDLKALTHMMLKKLKESELQTLLCAIDSNGAQPSDCVMMSSEQIRRICHSRSSLASIAPHLLCCRVWRFATLQTQSEIKPLFWCNSNNHSIDVCINPYHWSQIYRTGLQDNYCSTVNSVHNTWNCRNGQLWCSLAYWEHQNRVGRLFPVYNNGINVFSHLPQGEGLWLEPLFTVLKPSEKSVLKTREKIGFGVSIHRHNNCVWVYNRSNHPIFVNSPTLDPPNTRNLTVFKVLPGFSINAYDYDKAKSYQKLQLNNESIDGVFDPNAFRISFAKGWGPNYSRQYITSCPCWLEVLLSVPVT